LARAGTAAASTATESSEAGDAADAQADRGKHQEYPVCVAPESTSAIGDGNVRVFAGGEGECNQPENQGKDEDRPRLSAVVERPVEVKDAEDPCDGEQSSIRSREVRLVVGEEKRVGEESRKAEDQSAEADGSPRPAESEQLG
jgi:hypothetical protein